MLKRNFHWSERRYFFISSIENSLVNKKLLSVLLA
jgi:hypothetical protein